MEFIVGDDIFTSNETVEVVLPLYLAHNGMFFPCEHWTDFASILDMWAYDLLKYSKRKTGKFIMYFMDGPYRLDVTKNENNVTIQCVNAHDDETITETISCTYAELLRAVRKASGRVGKALYEKGMHQGRHEPIYKQTIITGNDLRAAIEGIET